MNIFLTGDSSGIGKAIFENFKDKYNVFGVSRTGQYKCDLTNKKQVEQLIDNFKNTKFDIIIFNAGKGYFGEFEKGDIKEYENILNLNLFTNIQLLKGLNYDKKKTKIIFIGSIISKKFMKGASVYQASKFALRGLAGGLKSEGYKIYIINPKIVATNFHPQNMDLSKFPQTSIESIVNEIENIINGNEKKFEIDL